MCIVICTLLLSRPARGAWVEIINLHAVIVIVCTHRIFGHESCKIIVFALLGSASAAGLTNYGNFHKATILSSE